MKTLRQRPALRWHGGKWMLAPWIIGHFPRHRTYTEVYGGAASVLLRKPRAHSEVYNDLDGEVVNLFRVLQEPKTASRLKVKLALTPFAREEFKRAYEKVAPSPTNAARVERARRLVVKCFMGFGSNAHNKLTGFRANSSRSGTTPAHDWANYTKTLHYTIERLKGVVIENKDAKEILLQHDSAGTLHYVDPPYVLSTRSDKGQDYFNELSEKDHGDLLTVLETLKGAVVLSGYPCKMYDTRLKKWRRVQRTALADGAKKRTEVLWIKGAKL